MALSKQQQESIFLDTVIHMFRINPQLYDKSEGAYVYTPQKIKLLSDISEYLKNNFEIVKEVQDIVAAWKKLVSAFKKADQKQATGSAASNNDFEYYEDLLFLKPTLKHKSVTSSMTPGSISNSTTTNSTSVSSQPTLLSTNVWPTVTTASTFSEGLALHPYYLPYVMPAAGQHPQWPVIPHTFASPMSMQYLPFPPLPLHAPQHLSPIATSTHDTQMPALLSGTSHNIVIPSVTQPVKPTAVKRPPPTPEYDTFAKKKLKTLNGNEDQFKKISNDIINTLDKVKKISSSASVSAPKNAPHSPWNESPQPVSVDYYNLLRQALSKVPIQLQDELMAYLLEELTKFNQSYKSM